MRLRGPGEKRSAKAPSIALLVFLLILVSGSWSPLPAQTGPEESPGPEDSTLRLSDPFSPPLPAPSLKVRYRLRGRFVGQEIMLARSTPRGTVRLNEIKAVDTAFGLERPVHLWILETPERLIRLDLVRGEKEVRANLRGFLSGLWQGLDQTAKLNLNRNLSELGPLLGRSLKISPALSAEAIFLGLPTVRVALEAGRIWYWAGTDVVLKETGAQADLNWSKTAIDLVQGLELPERLFELPLKETDQGLAPSRREEAWARALSTRIIALLSRPLVGLSTVSGESDKDIAEPLLAVPWPVPAPPGFRSREARHRLSPDWRPYPPSPDLRPWPPPGLGLDLLRAGAESIAALLEKHLPAKEETDNQDQ